MKTLLATVAALGVFAQSAMAFEFTGGDVALRWGHNKDFNQTQVSGNLAFGLSGAIGMQVGLKFADYTDDTVARSGEVQLTYDLGATDLAAFVGSETFGGNDDYTYFGVATAFTSGPVAIKAAISSYEDSHSAWHSTDLFIDGEYSFGQRSALLGGAHTSHSSSGWTDKYFYMGVSYEVMPNVDLSVTYGNHKWNTDNVNVATLGVTYDFGQGATFGQHSFTDLYPSD
ncbi:hypothetical protein [Rhodobacter ferrooxidans]|uniref:Porin n=1 Tax=Rhodobacter ferrooxidans TaxID=371731 RepID=C8S3X6_9RHOB|nr:hypothetical protein [Rhodobacter sp. SW2]EEW24345.1 hypothetical protein Rsw2DRAFT_2754 [Rhodobacter sp. SW2]